MDWDLKEELKDCLVAAAPYGGPIGMLPSITTLYCGIPGCCSGCSLPVHLAKMLLIWVLMRLDFPRAGCEELIQEAYLTWILRI